VAKIEELFKGRAETFQDQGIIFTLNSKPIERGDARASGKVPVDTDFIPELWVITLERFELDSDFFP
jgi:hypothetical protein